MNISLRNILILALLPLTLSAPAKEHNTDKDAPSESVSSAATDSVAAAPVDSAALFAQANVKLAELQSALTQAKLLNTELKAENSNLIKALDIAIPYAEAGLANTDELLRPLAQIDTLSVNAMIAKLRILAPFSKELDRKTGDLALINKAASNFKSYINFDNNPYSTAYIDSLRDNISADVNTYGHLLSKPQNQELQDLYVKVDSYEFAVESFAGLITKIDAEVAEFRGKKGAENIAKTTIDDIMTSDETKSLIEDIRSYRYLSNLLDSYLAELKKSPLSTTGSIRAEIAAMQGNTPTNN